MNKNIIFLMIISLFYASDGHAMLGRPTGNTYSGFGSNRRSLPFTDSQIKNVQQAALEYQRMQQTALFEAESAARNVFADESDNLFARMSASHDQSMREANKLLSEEFVKQRQNHDTLYRRRAALQKSLKTMRGVKVEEKAVPQSSSSSVGKGNDIFSPQETTFAQRNNRLIQECDALSARSKSLVEQNKLLADKLENLKLQKKEAEMMRDRIQQAKKSRYRRSLINEDGSYKKSGLSLKLQQKKQQQKHNLDSPAFVKNNDSHNSWMHSLKGAGVAAFSLVNLSKLFSRTSTQSSPNSVSQLFGGFR